MAVFLLPNRRICKSGEAPEKLKFPRCSTMCRMIRSEGRDICRRSRFNPWRSFETGQTLLKWAGIIRGSISLVMTANVCQRAHFANGPGAPAYLLTMVA